MSMSICGTPHGGEARSERTERQGKYLTENLLAWSAEVPIYVTSIKKCRMAGESSADESQLKGLAKYFNSQTNRGRANTAKATYAVMGVVILYLTLKPKKK